MCRVYAALLRDIKVDNITHIVLHTSAPSIPAKAYQISHAPEDLHSLQEYHRIGVAAIALYARCLSITLAPHRFREVTGPTGHLVMITLAMLYLSCDTFMERLVHCGMIINMWRQIYTTTGALRQ